MPFSKILIIDFSLVLLGIYLFFLLKKGNYNVPFFENLNKEKNTPDSFEKKPTLAELLEFEKSSRKVGSGILFESLIGSWEFRSVWKIKSDNEDQISSSLLRLFNATLKIQKNSNTKFDLINSIKFGFLALSFIGSGELKGKQPLLPFYFEIIELKLNNKILLSRVLKIPEEKNRPFFALIAMGEKGKWLSARGRGGGLALWDRS